MRGKIKKLLLCLVGIILVSRVSALCDSCASRDEAFQICNMASGMPENCYIAVYPRSETLIDYDGGYFSIRDNIIYLNNSTVSIYVHADSIMGSEQILNFNITGDNIIKELNSITLSEPTCKYVVDCLNLDYTYKPISITGDGSLEIEKTSILKRDTYGNQYYKCWTYSLIYGKKDRTTKCITKLTDPYAKSSVYNLYLPENGFTLSDLQDITYEDGNFLKSNGFDSLYYGTPGSTIESVMMISALTANSDPRWMSDLIELYNLNDTVLPVDFDLTAYDEDPGYRVQLITRLVNSGIILANKPATSLNQITQDWGSENIQTTLSRSFTESGAYLIGTKQEVQTELDTITTTQSGNIVFESTEEFDSNYHLNVDDITEELTDEQASKIEAKTDKTLIKLYDIDLLNKDNDVVNMKSGTYTIKIKPSDLLKKYNEYQIVYISDTNEVELIPAKVVDEYIVFSTTHLSKYGILGVEKTTKKLIDLGTTQEIKNPNTADNTITYGLVLFTLMVASITTIIRVKKISSTTE